MATINATVTSDSGRVTYTWSNITSSDVGDAAEVYAYPKISAQVIAASGGSIEIHGSNDGTTWSNAFSLITGNHVFDIVESFNGISPRYIRPANPSTTTTVVLVGQKEFAGI